MCKVDLQFNPCGYAYFSASLICVILITGSRIENCFRQKFNPKQNPVGQRKTGSRLSERLGSKI